MRTPSFTPRRVSVRIAALILGALPLGLVSATTSHDAFAEEEVEIEIQPPAPRVEVIPVAPSARHFWVHGYWGWAGGRHTWVPGRYEVMRDGWAWSESRWNLVGRRWHFYPGHWYR